MIWSEAHNFLDSSEETKQLLSRVVDIDSFELPSDYYELWENVSKPIQVRKAKNHNLTTEETNECFSKLSRRPYYLTLIAKEFNVKNIAEVGTAQGLQFYSFAKYLRDSNVEEGHVWSCDIIDVRNEECAQQFSDNTTFCLGDSGALSQQLSMTNSKIDLFYIDANHERGAVIKDVSNLKRFQHDDTIWIFDDFDVRFGCYEDIQFLCKLNKKFKIYNVGNAASGNPNHQVIVFGKI